MNAPIIVTALFSPRDQAWLDSLRTAHFPPERNHLAAHLTLFHHLPPSAAPDLDRRLREAAAEGAPDARVSGVMDLGRGTALRIESEGLRDIRAELADAFHAVLTPQDRGGWRPHVTIQNKVERVAASTLQQALAAEAIRRAVTLRGLASWWYRGGPWEPLAHHAFSLSARRHRS